MQKHPHSVATESRRSPGEKSARERMLFCSGLRVRKWIKSSLGEDHCKVRSGQAPQVLAALNNAVLALADALHISNLAAQMRIKDAHPERGLALLLGSDQAAPADHRAMLGQDKRKPFQGLSRNGGYRSVTRTNA